MDATTLTAPTRALAALTDRALARVRAAGRLGFYFTSGALMWPLALPVTEELLADRKTSLRDAYELHVRLLERPGMRDVLSRVEREDLATLPVFAASLPFDVLRVRRKRVNRVERMDVTPRDAFPYPDYYLYDFHHQANGNLSRRAALTYEWQIRFLFLGTNRLMRQGVIDQIPEGDDLDVLDVACGTASWITQARLQGRRHRVTGVDLSPPYLEVARLFRGRDATFRQMNAERMDPAWTNRFDLVTCIWLFHELPLEAQRNAAAEMARVLKPGGRLVFMDAMQPADLPDRDIAGITDHFRDFFNEPHFAAYQQLDLPALFAEHGLALESRERWYRSSVLAFTKRTST